MRLSALFFWSFLVLLNACQGQDKSTIAQNSFAGERVTEIDSNIWVIYQDKKGHYWFGSDGRGLYRYDGASIIHFTSKQGLCNDHLREILEDSAGNLFFGTLEGISKFDGHTFRTLTPIKTDPCDWRSAPGDLWFKGSSINNGPFRYDGKWLYQLKFPKHTMEDSFYRAFPGTKLSPYDVYTIYKDRKGNLWFGTSCLGACRFDGKTHSWLYEKHLTETPSGGSFGIRSILEDRAGKFWFCNTRYRYAIDPAPAGKKQKNAIQYQREKGIDLTGIRDEDDPIYYQPILEDDQGDLWLTTYGDGIWRYDGMRMSYYPVRAGDGTKDIKVVSMYRDRQGTLWLGTQEKGVYVFDGGRFLRFEPRGK